MNRTGIVADDRYMEHDMGFGHPENPERLKVIYNMLRQEDMAGQFISIPPRRAEKDELLWIHTADYVDRLTATEGQAHVVLDPDTSASPGSYEAAVLAAGGVCKAVSMVVRGALDNAFALVRPPGHHAERSRAMGFCLLNNVAVGAEYARKVLGLRRVLIVDWDLHHGNGTQHSFEDDSSVLYFSTHQFPYYPGSGAFEQVGIGKGEGFTVNFPLSPGYGDGEYAAIFERILKPIAFEFAPELILVSAGFDIFEGDPLGGMRVTPVGFAGLTSTVMNIADYCCGGKVVLTLEGGYDLDGLRDSVRMVLKEMAGLSKTNVQKIVLQADQQKLDKTVSRGLLVHGKYWTGL
jgi:acetoin utilization deacetylase AcuC-like enzyme